MLRALRFDLAHRPERVEGRLSKGNPKSAIRNRSPRLMAKRPGESFDGVKTGEI